MVFDTLCREGSEVLVRRLLEALEFLRHTDFSHMEEGRHTVNDWMFFLIQDYETKRAADAKFEAHRKYADIQYLVSGHEWMSCCDIASAEALAPFSEEKDCGKYAASSSSVVEFPVEAGQFAIFLPQDCHKPSYHMDGEAPCSVKKVVVKVRIP